MLTFSSPALVTPLNLRMAQKSVLLLEQLGCNVHFPEKQGCCGQPAINGGYVRDAIPGMKNIISSLEENDWPIVSPAGSCTYTIKNYARYLSEEPGWADAITIQQRLNVEAGQDNKSR